MENPDTKHLECAPACSPVRSAPRRSLPTAPLHPSDDDIEHVRVRRGWHSQLGFALQLSPLDIRGGFRVRGGHFPEGLAAVISDSGNTPAWQLSPSSCPTSRPWLGPHPAHWRILVATAPIAALAYDSAPTGVDPNWRFGIQDARTKLYRIYPFQTKLDRALIHFHEFMPLAKMRAWTLNTSR